jgi:hypothetical protein
MIPLAQFDPATLSIWTTTAAFAEPLRSIATSVMKAAARGENPTTLLGQTPPGHPQRARLLWLASGVWHEKRHFLDTCLTNYGARRFRDMFNLACNFGPLVAEALHRHEPIWFPVEVYGCPVQRSILGIPEPAPNILELARLARGMKGFVGQLDATKEGPIQLGAEAQMEGLAQVSQMTSIQHCFGSDDLMAVTQRHVERLPREGPYRAIESVAGTLGCVRDSADVCEINPGLAAALFVTSLCGRFFGGGPSPPEDLVAPWPRLARMMHELGTGCGRFDMCDEEAAAIVDRLARRLWGRTAFEEIAADIDAMECKFDSASAQWLAVMELDSVFTDFVALRRRLLATAQEEGPASLLPRAFPIFWRDRLSPWHVVATPGGVSEDEDDGPVVFGYSLNIPAELDGIIPRNAVWGRLDLNTGTVGSADLRPRAYNAWLRMLECHGPRAQLMLNGRRHRRMVPPELERPIVELQGHGVEVRFHPRFEWPEKRDQKACTNEAIELAEFTGRNKFVCDVTGQEIEPSSAAVITPWELRRSALAQSFRDEGILQEAMLLTDWSDWVVRRDLLE